MSINLLETVQQNLGYPPLQKIDPNTQETVAAEKIPVTGKFSQAAIPAVLAALYKYVQADEGAAALLQHDIIPNWISILFDDQENEAIASISAYALKSNTDTVSGMNQIAAETVRVVKENLSGHADAGEVKLFFSNQINDILLYLPVELHMGTKLRDDTLDDNTNKMEGPVSSLMQSIGSAFSSPVTGKEIKEQ